MARSGAERAAASAKTANPKDAEENSGQLPFPAQKAQGACVTRGAGRGGATRPHFTAAANWGVTKPAAAWIEAESEAGVPVS